MESFSYEYTKKFLLKELHKLDNFPTEWSLKKTLIRIMWFAISIALLFTKYTIGIGICILFVMAFFLSAPLLFPWSQRLYYRYTPFLNDELTYGVNQEYFWVKGVRIDVKAKWEVLKTWRENQGWLLLSSNSLPRLYFKISDLKKKGIYDKVTELCKTHSKK